MQNLNYNSQKILLDKNGKIKFVGTLKQIKRRLKKIFRSSLEDSHPGWESSRGSGAGHISFVLWMATNLGYNIKEAVTPHSMEKTISEKLKSKLKEVPKKPGVYQFRDKDGEVLYVGKAKNLRARLSQYLNEKDDRPQLPYLLAEMADFDYTVVNNELESLFLENTVIKQHLPKYNIMLRDDKNYAFIKIDYSCEIPQISIARKVESSQSLIVNRQSFKYFGPYSAAYKIRNTLNLVRRIFPYCSAQKISSRPCFYYYLHRCPGICIGKISLDEYKQQLQKIEKFLRGDSGGIKKELEAEMKLASSRQEFERAARLRDQCDALTLLEEKQTVIMPKKLDWDVISVVHDSGYACVNLFKIRGGKMLDKDNFVFELGDSNNTNIHPNDTNSGHSSDIRILASLIQTFCEQYYLDATNIPKEIFLQEDIDDKKTVADLLANRFSKKPKISQPKRGKAKELVGLGITNAQEYLKNWLASQAGHLDKINSSLQQLKDVLKLSDVPHRIECYDISNIQGTNAVGSMVVFVDGLPKKSEYRKFRIKTKQTPDDFAMMKEMLTRRMARMSNVKGQMSNVAQWPLPDLIVIDGGKGQLSAAVEVIRSILRRPADDFSDFPIIGLAKRIEEIFLPGQSDPIVLAHDQRGLQLLQRLRDEAHRFGITYHRKLRSKQAVKSALDGIPGIGPKTKKLLKEKFGTVAQIRKTPFDELAEVVGEQVAQAITQNL